MVIRESELRHFMLEDELMHYGVKGMKWGHHKARPLTGTRAIRANYKNKKRQIDISYSKAADKYERVLYTKDKNKLKKVSDEFDRAADKWAADRKNARNQYKAEKKAYKQTDEYKTKRAKAIKAGAALVGTTLAVYGTYKASKYLKSKAAQKSYEAGKKYAEKMFLSKKDNDAGIEALVNADIRTRKVKNSTIDAIKYLRHPEKYQI